MAICDFCDQEMMSSVSCTIEYVEYPDGERLPVIRYGQESWPWDGDLCHDCGTPKGGIHHPGCDVEECPRCNWQLIGCGCLNRDKDEFDW